MAMFDTITWEDIRILFISTLAITALVYIVYLRNRIMQLIRDRLTGLFTRLVFDEIYPRIFKTVYRRKFHVNGRKRKTDMVDADLSVIFMDIDHFKQINSKYGHLIADKVLRLFATLLEQSTRPGDLVARWGGDEFVVVLETKMEGALVFLKRFIGLLHSKSFKGKKDDLFSVTFTCGVASLESEEDTAEELLDRADQALMDVKNSDERDCCNYTLGDVSSIRKSDAFLTQ